ncbi:hypothetical protein KDA06_04940, partial [Candidatus Saccharibacteria bacterium]|nr:hypothetical protein [Candidatus Saccharibacteria bacterium]
MTDIEIPYEKDRRGHYRFFEMLPGIISWTMILVPFILSFIDVRLAAMFVFIYLLINFARGMAGAFRSVQGYRAMNQHQKLPWSDMLKELSMGTVSQNAKRPKWHTNVVQRSQTQPILMPPEQIIHAVIIATYKEAREVLEPTIQSVLKSDFNMKQVIFVLAYEERAGESTERLAHQLVDEYKSKFLHAMAVKHPHNIPGEVIGKGGNVT